ncbi:TlpA disulfide reductase family protein [Aureimonas glaciei]|uniref:Thiol:disulfide interchange protein n=1 Tax=Aureimonas glaciei TaxID=1776957 RepID=A0A917DAK6_9HYPH|nr:TlpA disulfide reductase family protein [Aureimonas glaciei]GGD17683.1 thiol:disulfide interchange protein [Aureimonas glaciei]
MTTLVIGPLAFAGDRLALLATILFLLVAGAILAWRVDARLGSWAMTLVPLGLVAGRLGHVLVQPAGFIEEPLRILAISDGGFWLPAALAAAVAYTLYAFRAWRLRTWSLGALAATAFVWTVAWQLVATTEALAAPETSLALLDGETTTLSAFRGGPVVVNLWATWCPPCRREMPMLVKAAAERPDTAFVFANQGEGPGAIIQYLQRSGLVIPTLVLDQGFALARHYSVQGYPATLFLDADGVLQDIHFGEISRETLDAKLAKAGATP